MRVKLLTGVLALAFVVLMASQCNSQRLTVERVKPSVLREDAVIVCAGDSISAHYVTLPPATHNYVSMMDAMLRTGAAPRARVVSAGISGNTSHDLRQRYEADVLSKTPDLVVILIGINDIYYGIPVGNYSANVAAIVEATRTKLPKCRILLCSPFLMARNRDEVISTILTGQHFDVLPQYVDAVRAIARANRTAFIDLHEEFQSALRVIPASYFCEESVHPGENGRIFIAQRIVESLNFKSLKQ